MRPYQVAGAVGLLFMGAIVLAGDKPRQNTLEYAHPDCIKAVGQDIHVVCPEDGEVLLVFHRGKGKHDKLMKDAIAIEALLERLDSAYTANAEKK